MNLKLILGAVLLLVALVFTVQNAGAVDVKFLAWKFSISLALVLFIALAAGLIGGWGGQRATAQAQSSKDFSPTMRTSSNGLVLIVENKWQHGMATFCKPFTKATVQYFDHTDAAEVRKSLGEA